MQTPYTPTDPRPAILLVDDDPFVLSALQQYLGRMMRDYDIIALNNAAEALARVFWQPVPLLITDFAMLGMNGMQLTQQIKELSPDTRIILISAYAQLDVVRGATAHGVDAYLQKPFQLEELAQVIQSML
jgi:DNA-binding NtrC family response regulator